MTTSATTSTVDPEEIARFSRIAGEWWDPKGKFKPLHQINPLRLGFIKEEACRRFGRDLRSTDTFSGLRVLDIGCGGGLLSEPIARLGGKVLGQHGAVHVARPRHHRQPPVRQAETPDLHHVQAEQREDDLEHRATVPARRAMHVARGECVHPVVVDDHDQGGDRQRDQRHQQVLRELLCRNQPVHRTPAGVSAGRSARRPGLRGPCSSRWAG